MDSETKDVQAVNTNALQEIHQIQSICEAFLQHPLGQKIGPLGVNTIVAKAFAVGMNPIDALNGGMYYVKDKVELSAASMNQLIRKHKHRVQKDARSDETVCILHGKRADTGDEWTASFSIEEAKAAGIYKGAWLTYPQDMLFARALTRLARQLFPDVIKGCYIQGEIQAVVDADNRLQGDVEVTEPLASDEMVEDLRSALERNEDISENVLEHIKSQIDTDDLTQLPERLCVSVITRLKNLEAEKQDQTDEKN